MCIGGVFWKPRRVKYGGYVCIRYGAWSGVLGTGGRSMVDWTGIFVWGLAATAVLTVLLRGSQALHLTRLDIPFMLGTVLTADRDLAKLLGFFWHLVNGWAFSIGYALAFAQLGRASPLAGGLLGLLHGLFVLTIVFVVLPGLHPRMASDFAGPTPTKELEPPGFMALNYGLRTPAATLIGHVVYGAILGTFYHVP